MFSILHRKPNTASTPPPQPNFDALLDLPPHTIINVLPPDLDKQLKEGELLLYRAACLGRLSLNLAQGRNEINAPATPRKKDNNIHLIGGKPDYAEWFAKDGLVLQLGESHKSQLRELTGRDFVTAELPRIVMGVTLAADSPGLKFLARSKEEGDLYHHRGPIGFEAVDEHSRQAMEELLQIQLPPSQEQNAKS